jgi:probable addiction module antidote protein
MALETLPWDPRSAFGDGGGREGILAAAFEDGDPALIAAALGDVARMRGTTEIAREGLSREAMYKGLRPEGNPTLDTLARVVRALGLKLTVRAA